MRKSKKETAREGQDTAPGAARGRILARVLAEDLRTVRGEEDPSPITVDAATRTDPPPGYDLTYIGSDNAF
jgi:hypothetical protein